MDKLPPRASRINLSNSVNRDRKSATSAERSRFSRAFSSFSTRSLNSLLVGSARTAAVASELSDNITAHTRVAATDKKMA